METKTRKWFGYKWQPRVKKPKRCLGCKSPYWETERTRIRRKELQE